MTKFFLVMAITMAGMVHSVTAQKMRKWDFGITAELGRDYFDRVYPPEYDKYPEMIRSFQSNYSWGAGIWAEKHFSRSFSGLARINYMQKDMHPDVYGEPSRTADKWFTKEKHHHVIADVGGRWYVNPKSAVKVFLDVKAGVNTFIAIDIYEYRLGKITNREIFGYDHLQPVGSAAAGLSWKRLGLMAEYNRDLRRADRPGYTGTIQRQGVTVKASFSITKPQ